MATGAFLSPLLEEDAISRTEGTAGEADLPTGTIVIR